VVGFRLGSSLGPDAQGSAFNEVRMALLYQEKYSEAG
jgi:hypothetical protein